MQIHFKIIGVLLMALALIHIIFPKYFNWKEDLKTLNLINQQMMKVHTFFIAFIVFLMGLLLISSSNDLITTTLGKKIVLGLAIFWAIRLYFQLFVYSTKLWKGKRFETYVHILFTLLWSYINLILWISYFK